MGKKECNQAINKKDEMLAIEKINAKIRNGFISIFGTGVILGVTITTVICVCKGMLKASENISNIIFMLFFILITVSVVYFLFMMKDIEKNLKQITKNIENSQIAINMVIRYLTETSIRLNSKISELPESYESCESNESYDSQQ